MTLPNEEVMAMLNDRFVIGWHNIERDPHVGLSHGYRCDQTAVGTTNGAGGRNVQIVVLAADGTVLHALPGFWHAEDLLGELRLALEVFELWHDESSSLAQKEAMFRALHRSFVHRLPEQALARGEWQSFDVAAEVDRARTTPRDTMQLDANGNPVLGKMKPIAQLVHERMAARPFRKFDAFDMESYVDYGRAYYDNNAGLDRGRPFSRAEQVNRKRERELAKVEKAAAKKAPAAPATN